MEIRGSGSLSAFAALMLLAGAPAEAIDSVTGTYAGKLSCHENASGAVSKFKQDVTVEILLVGAIFNLDILAGMTSVAESVRGVVVADAAKADRATLAGVDCILGAMTLRGTALDANIVIKPGSEKGTVKGTLIQLDSEGSTSRICSLTAKRTSTADLSVFECIF